MVCFCVVCFCVFECGLMCGGMVCCAIPLCLYVCACVVLNAAVRFDCELMCDVVRIALFCAFPRSKYATARIVSFCFACVVYGGVSVCVCLCVMCVFVW